MPRIKITQTGWAGFTGNLGITEFHDGVSVESVNRREIAIIGASLSLVEVDEDGKEGTNPALQHQIITNGTMTLRAEVLPELTRATETEVAAVTPKKADPDAVTFHTKEELEKIAETKGIHGLREIMEPMHLKAGSINKAIQVILKEELKLKAQLEAAGTLQREDAAKPTETPNEVVEGEEGEKAPEGEKPAEENASQTPPADQSGTPPEQNATQEPPASTGDAGPAAENTEA